MIKISSKSRHFGFNDIVLYCIYQVAMFQYPPSESVEYQSYPQRRPA